MPSAVDRLRCRVGVHRWRTVGAPDGQYVRTCRTCGLQEGPFPRVDAPGPRIDPHDLPPGGS